MSGKNDRYFEIDSYKSADVVLAITERRGTEHRSFRLQKRYEQDGQEKHTAYLSHRHVPHVVSLVLEYLREHGDHNRLLVLKQIKADVSALISKFEIDIARDQQEER